MGALPHAPSFWAFWWILGMTVLTSCARPGAPAPPPASTATQGNLPRERSTVVVGGRGKVRAKPDLGRVTFAAITEGPTVAVALRHNNTKMAALVQALKSAGIAERDIQTNYFSVHSDPPSYRVQNGIDVSVRNVDRVGEVVDTAVKAGANAVFSLQFEVEKRDALEAEIRSQAIKDARSRADALATLSGMKLGTVLSISEVPGVDGLAGTGQSRSSSGRHLIGGGPVPFESGELTYERELQVIYAIEPSR